MCVIPVSPYAAFRPLRTRQRGCGVGACEIKERTKTFRRIGQKSNNIVCKK